MSPLVRITSTTTGRVYYARTFNHSRMGVEPTGSFAPITTEFEVPASFDNGPATLVVVANGIASAPANVDPPLGVVNVAKLGLRSTATLTLAARPRSPTPSPRFRCRESPAPPSCSRARSAERAARWRKDCSATSIASI